MALILLTIILSAAEIAISIKIANAIGILRTIVAMVVVACIGLILARLEIFAIIKRLEKNFKANESLTDASIELVFIAGGIVLLFLPGFITDIVAFLFILPPTRAYFAQRVSPAFRHKIEDIAEKKRQEFLNRPKTNPPPPTRYN